MNKRAICFLIPAALLPFMAVAIVVIICLSTKVPVCQFIMEQIFLSNVFIPLGGLLLFSGVAIILSIICCISYLRQSTDDLQLAKTVLFIKLAQIPVYLVSFVLGLFLSVLGLPLVLIMLLFNFFSLFSLGLNGSTAVILAHRQARFTRQQAIALILTQFIFCIDVISSAICFTTLNKQSLY